MVTQKPQETNKTESRQQVSFITFWLKQLLPLPQKLWQFKCGRCIIVCYVQCSIYWGKNSLSRSYTEKYKWITQNSQFEGPVWQRWSDLFIVIPSPLFQIPPQNTLQRDLSTLLPFQLDDTLYGNQSTVLDGTGKFFTLMYHVVSGTVTKLLTMSLIL